MQSRIESDLKAAMKSGDKKRVATLRLVLRRATRRVGGPVTGFELAISSALSMFTGRRIRSSIIGTRIPLRFAL